MAQPIAEQTKTCTKCGEEKPLAAYGTHPNTRDKLRTSCKPCNSAQTRAWNKANPGRIHKWNKANPDKLKRINRNSSYKRRYGISLDEYERLLAEQNGACAICKGEPAIRQHFSVDHDHDTGAVRGLLCHHCNSALGHMRDNPDLLVTAAAYLRHFGAWQGARAEDAAG